MLFTNALTSMPLTLVLIFRWVQGVEFRKLDHDQWVQGQLRLHQPERRAGLAQVPVRTLVRPLK